MKRVADKPLHYFCLFSSLGLCHSLCTMVFHSLGVEFPCIEGTLLHTFLFYSFPCFFKGVMGRLIRRAVVVWWFIKGLSSSILIYATPFYYFFHLPNHYYCPSPLMWQPKGLLALQGVTAPPCGLFFRHFIHVVWVKVLIVLYILYILYILLLLFYI